MSPEQITQWAKECGLTTWALHERDEKLTAFANLVAAHEREACALVCDDINEEVKASDSSQYAIGRGMGLALAAGAIRARKP